MRIDEYFDKAYRSDDRFWSHKGQDRYSANPDDHPYSLVTQLILRLAARETAGAVLDLGAGEGMDAIRFAKLGYTVDAIEANEFAAAKIARFAAENGVRVNVAVGDVRNYIPTREYDFVICNGVLQYIEDKDTVLHMMQTATKPKGFNVVSAWSTYSPVPASHVEGPVYCDDEDGEIVKAYLRWEKHLLYFEREKNESSHHNLAHHRHSHIKLIARNTAGQGRRRASDE